MSQKSDLGTPELRSRGFTLGYNADGDKVARVMHQTRLETIYNRGLVEDNQYHAARQLQNDHYISGLAGNLPSSIDFSVKGNFENFADFYAKASKRYFEVMNILSSGEKALIIWVVLDDGYMKDFQKQQPQYMNIGYNILRDALDKVAKYYGI